MSESLSAYVIESIWRLPFNYKTLDTLPATTVKPLFGKLACASERRFATSHSNKSKTLRTRVLLDLFAPANDVPVAHHSEEVLCQVRKL
jgi:hypothetical protein